MREEEYIQRKQEKILSRRIELNNLRKKDSVKYCNEIDMLEQAIERLEDDLANL